MLRVNKASGSQKHPLHACARARTHALPLATPCAAECRFQDHRCWTAPGFPARCARLQHELSSTSTSSSSSSSLVALLKTKTRREWRLPARGFPVTEAPRRQQTKTVCCFREGDSGSAGRLRPLPPPQPAPELRATAGFTCFGACTHKND